MVDEVKLQILLLVLFAIINGSVVSGAICCNKNPLINRPTQPALKPVIVPKLIATTCARTNEYSPLAITCPQGRQIIIIKAWYGVLDPATCSANLSSYTTCGADVTATVNNQCSYSIQCTLSQYNSLFGFDPCPNKVKGLDVEYICQSTPCNRTSESTNVIMSCPAGSIIVINQAKWYGIIDPSACFPTQCSTNVTANVASICRNINSCAVSGSIGLFGDPCPGTVKHLSVDYGCQPIAGFLQSFGCEYNNLTISCSGGRTIRVVDAFYGNVGPVGTCNIAGSSAYTCFGNATAVVKASCEGHTSCTLSVGNALIGDPCVGTYKYLTVNYFCVSIGPP